MGNDTFLSANPHPGQKVDDEKSARFERGWHERWTAVVDFLGGCRPLDLVVAACAMIEVVAIAEHLFTGR